MIEADIIAYIRHAYGGDLTDPQLSFVGRQLEERPYREAVEQISSFGNLDITEETDPNYMVSFGYTLTMDHQIWVLELSMLGPLGVFARGGDHQWQRLIYPTDADLRPIERRIFEILAEHHVTFPSREVLEEPLEMTLGFTDPENARVYHALFSDEDFLPWQFSPLYRQRQP